MCKRIAYHTPKDAVEGGGNCQNPRNRWNTIQSNERLVRSIRVLCKTVVKVSNTVLSKVPADIKQKTVVEHPFKKCCVTSALDDTRGAAVWKNVDIDDCDKRDDSEESDLEYEVIVIT